MSQGESAACSPLSTTRKSATRYSLNAFGRALADVMNKDAKDSSRERAAKKPRDNTHSSRRTNAATANGSSDRRSSIGERPPSQEYSSPAETITRTSRRRSALLKDAVSSAALAGTAKASPPVSPAILTRRSTLRPRPLGNGSALPKYRPRSALVESYKPPPSPPHLGTRKRVTSSDEENHVTEVIPTKHKPGTSVPHEKATRPISPLPQRALPTSPPANLSPSPPAKPPPRAPSSPTRNTTPPNKVDRTVKASTPSRSTIPRPPSSTSSSSSLPTPRTPTRQTQNNNAAGKGGTPSRNPLRRQPESPLRKPTKQDTIPKIVKVDQFNRSHSVSSSSSSFTEGDSVDDIEFMLGSIVSPTAPTPALPRIHDRHQNRLGDIPQTPSRTSNLPTRANLSYLSPMPPPTGARPSLMLMRAGHDRGSLLSWDQLVAVGDKTLGEGEVEKMIADIPAPFSPAPSTLDLELAIPESPSLSALPSPAGYGTISQVLLPDVTPSPASIKHMQSEFIPEQSRPAAADASLVVMLRLQLASIENIAKERLSQITALEAQLGAAKEARMREVADLAAQVSALEEQMHISLENRERAADERVTLEEQLRGAGVAKELAVQEAVKKVAEDAARLRVTAEEAMGRKCKVASAAHSATTSWMSVRELAEGELEFVRSQRETLAFLLADLVLELTSGSSVTIFTMTFLDYLMMPNDPEYDFCNVPRYLT